MHLLQPPEEIEGRPTPRALFLGGPTSAAESPPCSPAVLPRRRSTRAGRAPLSLLLPSEPRLFTLERQLDCVQAVLFEAQRESMQQLAQEQPQQAAQEGNGDENWAVRPRGRRGSEPPRGRATTAPDSPAGPSPQQLAAALREAEEAREAAASASAERDELAALLAAATARLSTREANDGEPPSARAPSPTPLPPLPSESEPDGEEFRSVQSELLRLERRRSREALCESAELRASLARTESLLRELRAQRAEAPRPPPLLPPLRPPPESAYAARALQRSQRLLHPPPTI